MNPRDKAQFGTAASSSSSSSSYTISPGVSTVTETTTLDAVPFLAEKADGSEGNIERAIYAHIRALRTLGKESINTEEIAMALSLPVKAVNKAIEALKDKGITAAKK
jgi:hypothetical protein